MNEWFLFILTSLAVWRVSHMLVKEDGLWEVFFRLRIWAGAEWDAGAQEWTSEKVLGQLLTCPLCLSVWLSAVASLFLWWLGPLASLGNVEQVLWWLAVSGLSCVLELNIGD